MSASSKEVTRMAWTFTREYSHARAYLHALRVPRYETFSKLVERREAAKLYLAHKLARFFFYRVSNTCVCPRKCMPLKRRYRVHAVAGNWLTSRHYTTCVSPTLVCQVTCERYCMTYQSSFVSGGAWSFDLWPSVSQIPSLSSPGSWCKWSGPEMASHTRKERGGGKREGDRERGRVGGVIEIEIEKGGRW